MSIKLLIIVLSLILIGAVLYGCIFRSDLIKKYVTDRTKSNGDATTPYVSMGLVWGVVFGAAIGNVGLGIACGLAIGSGIGYFLNKRDLKKSA